MNWDREPYVRSWLRTNPQWERKTVTSSFGAMVREDLVRFIEDHVTDWGLIEGDPHLYVSDVVGIREDPGLTVLTYEVRGLHDKFHSTDTYHYPGSFTDLLKELIFP